MLLLGHRGARSCRSTPENTLASFELCLRHGCHGFEFDVRCSLDGEAVICHNATYKGTKIAQTPAKSLGLPTLTEVLEQFSSRAYLDIELKVAGLESQTIAAFRKHPPQKGCVVSSFLPEVLKALHDLDGGIPLGLLCDKRRQLPVKRRGSGPTGRARTPVPPSECSVEWVILRIDLVDQMLVDQLHAEGKKVMVWTVNRAEDIRRLAEWAADAIISDETEAAVRVLRGA